MRNLACVSPTQHNFPWHHRELHRRPQCLYSHAPPPPSTAFRSPIGSSTEGRIGCTRMRLLRQ
eukprot:6299660-Pyramimonas_sp.AAC.1